MILYLALTAAVIFRHQLIAIFRITEKLPESKYVILRAMLTWFKAEIIWSCALMEVVLINAAMQYNYSLATHHAAAGDHDHTDIPVLSVRADQAAVDKTIINRP